MSDRTRHAWLFCFSFLATPVQAQDWYKSEASRCFGVEAVGAAAAAIVPASTKLEAITPVGNFAAKMTPSELRNASKPEGWVTGKVVLDASASQSFKSILRSAGDSAVPVAFKLVTAFMNNIVLVGNIMNVAAGWLFDQAYSEVDAQSLDLKSLALLIAEDGEISQQQNLAESDDKPYLVSTAMYRVSVGNEKRASVLYGCVFPVNLIVNQFTTQGSGNNKAIKPVSGSRWGIWDLEGSRWDDDDLAFDHKDFEFYYFRQKEVDNGQVTGYSSLRISVVGGPYQKKRTGAANYSTYYANVLAD